MAWRRIGACLLLILATLAAMVSFDVPSARTDAARDCWQWVGRERRMGEQNRYRTLLPSRTITPAHQVEDVIRIAITIWPGIFNRKGSRY